MSLRIFIGGVLEVPGDKVGLALASVGSSGQIALKCDTGQRTAEQVTINAPAGCEVSKDGVAYGPTAVYAAGAIADTAVPCYVRRTQAFVSTDNWTGGMTTPRIAFVATEEMTGVALPPRAFVPSVTSITSSGAVLTFGTTDPNDDALTYKAAVTTSPTPPSTWTMADSTSPLEVSGLNPVTPYYAHVRAFDGALATIGTSPMFTTASGADVTPPTLYGAPLDATPGYMNVVLYGPQASDAVGIDKWQYRVDSNAWVDILSKSTTMPQTTVPDLTPVPHTFQVRALDKAGNASSASNTATATPTPFTGTSTVIASESAALSLGQNRTIARHTDGTMYAVYDRGTPSEVYLGTSTDGGATWSEEAVSADGMGGYQPVVGVDSAGRVHVVWYGKWSGSTTYFGLRYRQKAGGAWKDIVNAVAPTVANRFVVPDLFVDASGNLHVVGRDGASPFGICYVKGTNAAGTVTWGSVESIEATGGLSKYAPSVACDSDSYPYVAYRKADDAPNTVYIKHRRSGSWSAAVSVATTTGTAQNQSIWVSGSGATSVVLVAYDDGTDVFIKKSTDGGATFGAAVTLSGVEGTVLVGGIACNGTTVYVAWQGIPSGGTYKEVFVRPVTVATLAAGATVNVTSASTVDKKDVALLKNPSAGFVAHYVSADATPTTRVHVSSNIAY